MRKPSFGSTPHQPLPRRAQTLPKPSGTCPGKGNLLEDPKHLKEVTLPKDDWQALVTWVDANAPYHDKFYNRRPPDGEPIRNIRQEFGQELAGHAPR